MKTKLTLSKTDEFKVNMMIVELARSGAVGPDPAKGYHCGPPVVRSHNEDKRILNLAMVRLDEIEAEQRLPYLKKNKVGP